MHNQTNRTKAIQSVLGALSSYRRNCTRGRFNSFLQTHKPELSFFFVVWLAYLALAVIGYNHILPTILRAQTEEVYPGSMLGYDNYYFFFRKGGIQDIAHPFVGPWHWLFGIIGLTVLPIRINLLLQMSLMATLVAATVSLVFSYAYRLRRLPFVRSVAIASIAGCSFTALCLSFTCEYYPFSFFFLVLSLYLLERDQMRYGRYRKRTVWGSAFITGGITLTNVAKPTFALLLQKPYKEGIRSALRLAACFTTLLIVSAIVFRVAFALRHDGLSWIGRDVADISDWLLPPSQSAIDAFFAQPLYISALELLDFNGEVTWRPTPYASWSYVAVLAPLLLISLVGIIRSRKEKAIRLMLCYLSVDVLIHLIFHYGMQEAIIFGGHWVFLPALFMAYAYPPGKGKQLYYALDLVLLLIAVLMLWHNLSELSNTVLCFTPRT